MNDNLDSKLEQQLNQLIEQTPQQITPQRSLWPGIAKRIKTNERPQQWPLVASLLIGLTIGGLAGSRLQPESTLAIEPLLLALEQQHQQRLAQLPQRNPWVRATDLAELRNGSQQLYRELLQQPDNQQLFSLWLWTQQRELELLKTQHRQSL